MLHGITFFEVGTEETRGFHADTHDTKHDGKVILVSIRGILLLDQQCLPCNLCVNLIMWKTGGGENRNFLSTSNGVHDINGRNTGLDHSFGVITRGRVDWLSVDIQVCFGKNLRCLVDDLTRTIEGLSKHLFGNTHL